MSWAADGQDRNGLHLEKNEANFFSVFCFCLEKLAATLIVLYFVFANSLDNSLCVFFKYFVYNKVTWF